MRRERFLDLGGYNENLRAAAWTENELIGRAILRGYDVTMLDERVFHGWHAIRVADDKMEQDSNANYEATLNGGGALAILYYPTAGILRTREGDVTISVRPQLDSVVNITHHMPYNDDYWQCIHTDKRKRLQIEQGEQT
jgi:hypothetical protein